ncbi:MAG: CoA pyrophosphatase [Myxococcales bacterium]|nr:CoA pyrophosphatase [Myxococcales bacterium]
MPRADAELTIPACLDQVARRLEGLSPVDRAAYVDRHSAVAALLREHRGEPEVLFIRRAERPGDPWSGHMAFPGGRKEPGDPDLVHTAERETFEELGFVPSEFGRLVGRLDDVEAVARGRRVGMIVRPYVYVVERDPRLRPNEEVAEAFWSPLRPMLEGRVDTVRPYVLDGKELALPAYDLGGRIVWGLTYHMLQGLFRLFR